MMEQGELIAETRQKARKHYDCDDCGRKIHPREDYSRALLVYDGSKYTWRRCDACDRWINSGLAPLFDGSWEYEAGGLIAWVEEAFMHDDGWIYVDDELRAHYGLRVREVTP